MSHDATNSVKRYRLLQRKPFQWKVMSGWVLGALLWSSAAASWAVADNETTPVVSTPTSVVSREQNIVTLEALFLGSNVLATDGALVQSVVMPLKQANRKVTDGEWVVIAEELSQRTQERWLKPHSPYDVGFREALSPLSDADCALLVQLLSSDAWRQFEAQLKTAPFKQSMERMLKDNADDVNDVIGQLVKAHHLRWPQ